MKDHVKPSQWRYWRDDKGYECAAKDYYPNTFANDPVLWLALKQLAHVKATIDTRMAELAGEDLDELYD